MTRKSARFFKTRRTPVKLGSEAEPSFIEILADVNKYIFVQDFERAESFLSDLSHRFETNCEIHFRRIEVATRLGTIEQISKEYRERRRKNTRCEALAFAALLTEIRVLERDNGPFVEKNELINPSLQLKKIFDLDVYSQQPSSQRFLTLRGQTLHLNRNPLVADDLPPLDLPLVPTDFVAEPESSAKQHIGKSPVLDQAIEYVAAYPNHYAAHFVLGCAFEFVGDLNDAIESWNKAFELNSNSLTVLSTMAELQQIGALPNDKDYISRFEAMDKNLVHGSYDTHVKLYREFLDKGEFKLAIAALRTLGDWLQKQRGSVPPEIEVLCLVGAMKAYSMEGNTAASEACLHEVENLVVSIKKSPKNASQVYFVAQLCDEFGLKSLSKILYLSILTTVDAPVETLIRVSAHMVTHHASPALKECLKVTYRNTQGHPEIRFCQLLCSLAIAKIPFDKYLSRRAQIRDLISKREIGRVFSLLNEALRETTEDPEVHYYLGEMLERLGSHGVARQHFELMYELDELNVDTVLRYMSFLQKNKDFPLLIEIAKRTLDCKNINSEQASEAYFMRGTAFYALQNSEMAKDDCNKALAHAPWKIQYLCLALQVLQSDIPDYTTFPHPDAMNEFISHVYGEKSELSDTFVLAWHERARFAMERGFYEYAFNAAKCIYTLRPEADFLGDLLVKASAAYHSRIAVQHVLMLLNSQRITLSTAAISAAGIYAQAGEWPLVDEWTDIAERSSNRDDKSIANKIFSMRALRLAVNGSDLKRAQNLLESVFDNLEGKSASSSLQVLYGYILAMQGDLKQGLERIRQNVEIDPNIQSLYFYIKTLERAGMASRQAEGALAHLFQLSPTNSFELKLVEEIYCISGMKNTAPIKALAC